MFRAKLKESKHWKALIESIGAIVSEAYFKITDKAIEIEAIDMIRVAMIRMILKKVDFEEYTCPTNEQYKLGINIIDLLKIIKQMKGTDELLLEYNPKEKKLCIQIQKKEVKVICKFSLTLVDIEEEGEEVPFDQLMGLPLENTFCIDCSYLNEALASAEIYCDAITFIVNPNQNLVIKTEGNIGEFEYVIDKKQLISHTLPKRAEANFTISKFKAILKPASFIPNLALCFDIEAPIKITYDLFKESRLIYFLAPRVEEKIE